MARKGGCRRGGIIPARAGFTAPRPPPTGSGSDHPRSRGVYRRPDQPTGSADGSSPLARGLPAPRHGGAAQVGIIPARAGFTSESMGTHWRRRDHPRSRGVYRRVTHPRPPLPGSSPLARGLRRDAPGAACTRGIIPARAGFTSREMPHSVKQPDHPRSRGVYFLRVSRSHRGPGSSPLARGLLGGADDSHDDVPDHPRSRGVYHPADQRRGGPGGSSPLARGLHRRLAHSAGVLWIIPARAGFTHRSHPRQADRRGSSPLARGLPAGRLWPIHCVGIIPARAGFTQAVPSQRQTRPDHPRSRGVYSSQNSRS